MDKSNNNKNYDQKEKEIKNMIEKREIANKALKKLLKGLESDTYLNDSNKSK